jgi:hypothetical protein
LFFSGRDGGTERSEDLVIGMGRVVHALPP